ncbi:MAG: ATP-binding protein [Candidatus Binatia bacterium]
MKVPTLAAVPPFLATKKRAVLFLRWVVIITASYLVLFDRPGTGTDPAVALFVVVFLMSNLLGAMLPTRAFENLWLRSAFVLFDTAWISFGMMLAGERSSELFLLYFSVLFVAALGESEAMIAGGAALIALIYAMFLLRTDSLGHILTPGVLLRFPFLFGIATFYGYLVTIAKKERRAAEIARERERFRTDLLATLTHDLQSPLSAIAGMAEALLAELEGADETGRRGAFEAIRKAATECGELLATFLAVASPDSVRGSRRALVDLNAVVKDAIQHHRRLAAEKEMWLDAKLLDGLPLISGDRAHLHRAISNLLWNAIKFVPAGGHVQVVTGIEGGAVTVAVMDDGPGIPEGVRKRLFEPYVSEGDEAGTGLGLFIVRLVAEAHGGSVTVQSQTGRGSRVRMRFPIPADVALPASVATAPLSTSAGAPARARLHS